MSAVITAAVLTALVFASRSWASSAPEQVAVPSGSALSSVTTTSIAPTPGVVLRRHTFGSSGINAAGTQTAAKGTFAQESVIGQMKGTSVIVNAGFWHAPSGVVVPPPLPGKCGDLNGDENLEVTDLIVHLQLMVGLRQPTDDQSVLGDLNGNGRLDIIDAITSMQIIVGIAPAPESCGVV